MVELIKTIAGSFKAIHRLTAVVFLSSFCFYFSTCQVAYYNFNTESGFPSNEAYCTFQDRDGYMWFGTDRGVARYDGYQFKQFTVQDGLTDNTVFSIQQDENGYMWFLTFNGGICYYDGKKFYPHPQNDSIKRLFLTRIPVSWQVTGNKTIWAALINEGFYKIDEKGIKAYSPREKLSLKYKTNVNVLTLTNGKYLYSTFSNKGFDAIKGPEIRDMQSYPLDKRFDNISDINYTLVKTNDNKVLLGNWPILSLLSTNEISDILQWPQNVRTIKLEPATDNDSNKFWLLSKNIPSYLIDVTQKIGFLDSITFTTAATDICMAKDGGLWLSTLDQGVCFIPNFKIKKYVFSKTRPDEKVSLVTVHNNKLYAGLPNNSILEINSHFTSKAYKSISEPTAISAIIFSEKGIPFSNFDANATWALHSAFFTRIIQMSFGKYLTGGSEGIGIYGFKRRIHFFPYKYNVKQRVTALCKLTDYKYLIGTNAGLDILYVDDKGYNVVEDSSFSNIRITCFKLLKGEVYAVGTRGKGVYLCNQGQRYLINESKGLVSDLVEDVFFENDSTMWIATYKGLCRAVFFMRKDSLLLQTKTFTSEDGLSSNQINSICSFNGYLWLGTNRGLCYFKTSDLNDDTILIPLYLTDLYINGAKHNINNLKLKFNENNLVLNFNALYYRAVNGIRYKFRLKDRENWKYTDQNSVQYLGLPPGSYELQLAAEDSRGHYRSKIKSLAFTISPRFTDTLAFKAIAGFIILVIAIFIVLLLFTYQRLKSRNVIKLLQSEFKALNYQINPHFIFNVLNSIQYYIIRRDSERAVHFLNSFSTLIRRIVTNSKQPLVSVLEEVECLKEYLELEKLRLDNKFDYEINIDSKINIEEKILLPMIIQPLVENAIWHGIVPSNHWGKVKVDFEIHANALVCIVDDNGVGFVKKIDGVRNSDQFTIAMSNVKERLKIISELNGSTWNLFVEDKIAKGYAEQGTIITIKFPEIKK